MVCSIPSLGLHGVSGYPVTAECDLSGGLPAFTIVGLPDAAVTEARERVRSAIKNCGFAFPVSRITVNLAPAHLKKVGTLYDLPILVGILAAGGQIRLTQPGCAFLGELSLSGQLRPCAGMLPMALAAKQAGIQSLFVPEENAAEATLAQGPAVYPVRDVAQLARHLTGEEPISPAPPWQPGAAVHAGPDFAEVKGQEQVKRALEIAAAGGHNVLMSGPPGSGKSMLARRLPGILPDMTLAESLETTQIHSVMGLTSSRCPLVETRPFRSPHHTISPMGMAGGGSNPRPGEISLAHNGVLFLDELPEFNRMAMESLRQPLEDGRVTITRVGATLSYPCSLMLVAAMNPCPCGYFGHPSRECTCSPAAASRYLARVSGPLLDRIDLHIEVPPVQFDELAARKPGESSAAIRERVNAARVVQQQRYAGTGIGSNARIPAGKLRTYCPLSGEAQGLLRAAFERLGLSARGYDRVLKVARTIADLDGSGDILPAHVAEAVQYRSLDRKYWENR